MAASTTAAHHDGNADGAVLVLGHHHHLRARLWGTWGGKVVRLSLVDGDGAVLGCHIRACVLLRGDGWLRLSWVGTAMLVLRYHRPRVGLWGRSGGGG